MAPSCGERRTALPCRSLTLRSGSQVVRDNQAVLPDSHERLERVRQRIRVDQRARQCQSGANVILNLASRVGPLGIDDDIPRQIRRQQWSIFNVPLMWSAEGAQDCPMLEWLSTVADQLPRMNIGRDAVQVGWNALHHTFQSMGILSREDLSEQGSHFSGRVQERILNMVVATDARGSALESVYVQVALHACRSAVTQEVLSCARPSESERHLSVPVLRHRGRCWTASALAKSTSGGSKH